jgi:hypothetical protein
MFESKYTSSGRPARAILVFGYRRGLNHPAAEKRQNPIASQILTV